MTKIDEYMKTLECIRFLFNHSICVRQKQVVKGVTYQYERLKLSPLQNPKCVRLLRNNTHLTADYYKIINNSDYEIQDMTIALTMLFRNNGLSISESNVRTYIESLALH